MAGRPATVEEHEQQKVTGLEMGLDPGFSVNWMQTRNGSCHNCKLEVPEEAHTGIPIRTGQQRGSPAAPEIKSLHFPAASYASIVSKSGSYQIWLLLSKKKKIQIRLLGSIFKPAISK
jgi:hypothetical protein